MINIINDDNVTLSDLQVKLMKLTDTQKIIKDLEETIYNNNVEQYKIDDSIYYKKIKFIIIQLVIFNVNNLSGIVKINNNTLNVNGHILSNKSIDGVKF